MHITLVQLNFVIGDFEGNSSRIIRAVQEAAAGGSDLAVFPELSVCGYPPLDLLERHDFIVSCRQAVERIAREVPPDTGVLVGGPEFNPEKEGKLLYNSAFFLHGGKVQRTFRKSLLPTYDIFDEYRYFEPNRTFDILTFRGKRLAVTICEDLWDEQPFEGDFSRSRLYTTNPLEVLSGFRPDLVINLAASPFSHRKMDVKQSIFTGKASRYGIPIVYCNQVGAQTELVFEGASLAVNDRGEICSRLGFFREGALTVDLEDLRRMSPRKEPERIPDRIEMISEALVCGIRDYFGKLGFSKATLGLSGGLDSAVSLGIASRALGPDKMHVLIMPSQYSTSHSVEDAEQMARGLGVAYSILPIESLFNQFREALEPLFGDLPENIAEENIQARIRSTLLMALSNKFGHILLNTSNKSETAVGYGTLYGDMSGGLSVLGDVYKTDVYALADFLNKDGQVIPSRILSKPPSAELKPDQKDTDSLPPYEQLDQILERYIEKQLSPEKIIEEGFDGPVVEKIVMLVDRNEYKRYQTPPILRISSKAFGVGRRIPLVARY